MKHIAKITVVSLGAAALLAGGGGPAFAAAQTAQTAADAAGTTGATTGTTTAGSATGTSATAGISSRRAVQIAEKRVPGARVTDVDREWERGHRTWKVELEKGRWEYEVHVSVKNGKVVAFERDYED